MQAYLDEHTKVTGCNYLGTDILLLTTFLVSRPDVLED